MKHYYSLKKNRDFQFTYRVGKAQSCRLCTLVYVHDRRKKKLSRKAKPQIPPSVRIGFSVSRKIGNSVQRNRAKRRLREAVTPLIKDIRPGYNLIFIARAAVLDEPFADICLQIGKLLQKADLLQKGTINS